MSKNEVATIAEGKLPVGYDLEDIMQDAGAGQNMAAGDLGIPYLAVLQTNSPQVNPGHAKYIEGAQAGMFYNTATGEVFDGRKTGIVVIPAAYQRDYDEWKDRDSGEGGFVASHSVDSGILSKCKPNAKGKPALPTGNVVWETAKQFLLLRNPASGRVEQALMTLKSTMLKTNRRWNNLISSATVPGTTVQAPRWLYPYVLKTQLETKGENSWFTISVERLDEPVSVDEYKAAKLFNQMHAAGQVTVQAPEDEDSTVNAEQGSAAQPGDEEIPY